MGNDFVVMIHCLAYLAVHQDTRFSSQQLAHNACSNPVIIRRLMSLAAAKGYVSVTNGANGGYQIQVEPTSIRLGDLFLLVGENQRLQKQFKDSVDQVCLVANNMCAVMTDLQQEQIKEQIAFYQERTIADIVKNLQAKAAEKKNS